MSFYETYRDLSQMNFNETFRQVSENDVLLILQKDHLNEQDFLSLLSPAAESYLDAMAQKAHQLTIQHFGWTIELFAPLYVSDYCVNSCVYCSFSVEHEFPRRILTLQEVEREGMAIAATGIKYLLLLTGESPQFSDHEYLKACIPILSRHFTSISLEVPPMNTEQYKDLIDHGVYGLTLYQETYNEDLYREIHRKGPKRNYIYRMDAPERACQAGMKSVTIGPLLGLDDWRKEVFIAGVHAHFLQSQYTETEIGFSLPRIKPHLGGWSPKAPAKEKDLIQAMLAVRLYLSSVGITLSTRESEEFRKRLLPLGVTKMSAGSSTMVGGYSDIEEGTPQFETADERSAEQIRSHLQSQGYQWR